MEKRVIVFLIISLAVIIGYDFLLKEMGLLPPPQEQSAPGPSTEGDGSIPPPAGSAPISTPTPGEPTPVAGGSATADSPAERGPLPVSEEQVVEVDTDLFRAKFTNRGGVLKSWELKRYTTAVADGGNPVQLVYAGGKFKAPLSLITGDAVLTSEFGTSL